MIRMIKVFGWEKHIDDKISAKREEELAYQRKRIILEIISKILKCVRWNWFWVKVPTILQFLHPRHHHDRLLRLLRESYRDLLLVVMFDLASADGCHEGRVDCCQGLLRHVW